MKKVDVMAFIWREIKGLQKRMMKVKRWEKTKGVEEKITEVSRRFVE